MAMAGPVPGMPPGMGPVMVLSKCSKCVENESDFIFQTRVSSHRHPLRLVFFSRLQNPTTDWP